MDEHLAQVIIQICVSIPIVIAAVVSAIASIKSLWASQANTGKLTQVQSDLSQNTSLTIGAARSAQAANVQAVATAKEAKEVKDTVDKRLNGELEEMVERVVRNALTDLHKRMNDFEQRLDGGHHAS